MILLKFFKVETSLFTSYLFTTLANVPLRLARSTKNQTKHFRIEATLFSSGKGMAKMT